ncbi:hypothetical protein UFOVP218_146 [uncultured Caudovirales phage]|uniref:Uncharacterized protein n=1 Tax=uncultured Caudovirales phage TaxID=2100421 RepID=A0A6J7WL36_9CAUD|nr:hypothetical protein UFOVP218_146 [uncultured Caudovirales phage]
MNYCPIFLVMLVAACSTTVPVTQKFPQAPQELQQPCKPLEQVITNTTLSQLTKTVVNNYSEYHQCSSKVENWQLWYTQQKQIFEELK